MWGQARGLKQTKERSPGHYMMEEKHLSPVRDGGMCGLGLLQPFSYLEGSQSWKQYTQTPRLTEKHGQNPDHTTPAACLVSGFFSYVSQPELDLLLLATKSILIPTKPDPILAPWLSKSLPAA